MAVREIGCSERATIRGASSASSLTASIIWGRRSLRGIPPIRTPPGNPSDPGLGRGPTLWPPFGRGARGNAGAEDCWRLAQSSARGWGLSQAPLSSHYGNQLLCRTMPFGPGGPAWCLVPHFLPLRQISLRRSQTSAGITAVRGKRRTRDLETGKLPRSTRQVIYLQHLGATGGSGTILGLPLRGRGKTR